MKSSLKGSTANAILLSAGAVLTLVLIYVAIHVAIYGHVFPNPVDVKASQTTLTQITKGWDYIWLGPENGRLPAYMMRTAEDKLGLMGARSIVFDTLLPGNARWAFISILLVGFFCGLLTFKKSFWKSDSHRKGAACLFGIPGSALCVLLIAGGDSFYGFWRLAFPGFLGVASAVCVTPLLTNSTISGRLLSLLCWAAVVYHSYYSISSFPTRATLCNKHQVKCGFKAWSELPTRLDNYVWDVTNGAQDTRAAAVINSGFTSRMVIGQSDFLRGAVLFDQHRVIDLSGLVNADIAHSKKESALTRFSGELVLKYMPDLFFACCTYVSGIDGSTLDYHESDKIKRMIRNWPMASTGPDTMEEIGRFYQWASIEIEPRQYFNFLIHKDAVPKVRPDSGIRVRQSD